MVFLIIFYNMCLHMDFWHVWYYCPTDYITSTDASLHLAPQYSLCASSLILENYHLPSINSQTIYVCVNP